MIYTFKQVERGVFKGGKERNSYGERNKPRYGWKKEGREKRCETEEGERAGCKNLSKVSRQERENAGLTWIS